MNKDDIYYLLSINRKRYKLHSRKRRYGEGFNEDGWNEVFCGRFKCFIPKTNLEDEEAPMYRTEGTGTGTLAYSEK